MNFGPGSLSKPAQINLTKTKQHHKKRKNKMTKTNYRKTYFGIIIGILFLGVSCHSSLGTYSTKCSPREFQDYFGKDARAFLYPLHPDLKQYLRYHAPEFHMCIYQTGGRVVPQGSIPFYSALIHHKNSGKELLLPHNEKSNWEALMEESFGEVGVARFEAIQTVYNYAFKNQYNLELIKAHKKFEKDIADMMRKESKK